MNNYHIKQFNKVFEYIHLNLDGQLDIKTLSKIASISEYHFHRLIKAFLGESLGTFIKRIRVETGAKLLKYSDDSITDIAYKIGYETPTSFTKSFKKRFQVSPTQFRQDPLVSFENVKQKKEKTNFFIEVEKKKIDSFKIICHPAIGILKPESIEMLWQDLISYASQNKLLSNKTKFVGIHWDDPSITDEDNIRIDVCLSIENEPKNSFFPIKYINGGKYLCFVYKGDVTYLGDVYDQIFRDYILKEDIRLRNDPPFEQFINQQETTPFRKQINEIHIYIPIM